MTPTEIDDLIYAATGLVVLDEEQEADPQTDRGFLLLEGLLVSSLIASNLSYKRKTKAGINQTIGQSLRLYELASVLSGISSMLSDTSKINAAQAAEIVTAAQVVIGRKTQASIARSITAPWLDAPIQWTDADTQAMQYLARNNALWMGKHFDDAQRAKAANIVTRDFSLFGDNPEKLATRIKEGLVSMVEATDAYWQTYATNALNYARSYSALRTFQKSGKSRYRIVAVLDSRTTTICRTLNGRVYEVEQALEHFDRVAQAQSVDELSRLHPFLKDEKDANGDRTGRHIYGDELSPQYIDENTPTERLVSAGIVAPPFHFNCRSRIEWID